MGSTGWEPAVEVLPAGYPDGSRVLAAILFRQTVERDVAEVPTARRVWEQKRVHDQRRG